MTVLPFHSEADADAAAGAVAEHLASGGLLAYPTETVYGLGSRPVAEDVAGLARLKGRSAGKPFLLLVPDRQTAVRYGLEFTAAADALADHYWPGPLTLVLGGGRGNLPDALRGPEGGIAVRWTSHKAMARLLARLDSAITSTSANKPGGMTAPGIGMLLDTFGDAVETGSLLTLDGGVLGNVPPSTVVDCTVASERPKVIREGAIPLEDMRALLGSVAP